MADGARMKLQQGTPFEITLRCFVANRMHEVMQMPPDARANAAAEIVEVLASMLGTSIAIMAQGDKGCIDTLLEGTTQYVFEEAARVKGVVAKLKSARKA